MEISTTLKQQKRHMQQKQQLFKIPLCCIFFFWLGRRWVNFGKTLFSESSIDIFIEPES